MNSPKPTFSQIAKTNPKIRAWLDNDLVTVTQQRDRAFGEENETERAMCGQLMLATTVLLSANMVVLSNADLLRSLSVLLKGLDCVGAAALLLSVFAGTMYYTKLVKFHRGWGQARQKKLNFVRAAEYRSWEELDAGEAEILKGLRNVQKQGWLIAQKILLWSALLVFFLMLIGIMFDFTPVWSWLHLKL